MNALHPLRDGEVELSVPDNCLFIPTFCLGSLNSRVFVRPRVYLFVGLACWPSQGGLPTSYFFLVRFLEGPFASSASLVSEAASTSVTVSDWGAALVGKMGWLTVGGPACSQNSPSLSSEATTEFESSSSASSFTYSSNSCSTCQPPTDSSYSRFTNS